MGSLQWIPSVVVIIIAMTGVRCLRNVMLEVIPEVVERGHEVTLRCLYERENEPLYSVKWYRGKHEFYRYSPSETPPIKVFNITGITVHRNNSDHEQVTLTNVDYGLTGNFSCEVTADAPTFSTEESIKRLTVVSLPKEKPTIVTERSQYDTGDTLKANCSVPPSKPPVEFVFKLNTIEIGPINARQLMHRSEYKTDSNSLYLEESLLQWGELSIDLLPFHYSHNQLNLHCTAQIPGIYTAESQIKVTIGLREPVPAQITSDSSKTIYSTCILVLVSIRAIYPFLR
ncbi:platelet endothelial cell adhesion molecule [Diachasma alloeum]|uniref:platelet endothelial cell adhesion molecule n=1 Tax=Diachasma alloeum TaxID=454923 RepID=UPI0007381012|nr:platelet endothelial cell adhesion molecule [Diachasma alloeum]